jgi:hypothetical protein
MFASFPCGLPDHRFMLQFVLPAHPQAHEPSISPTISLPICEPIFISPTSYRNPPMGPPPSICFHRHLCPTRGTHFTLGHPFLYFVHLSQIYSLFCTNTFYSSHFQLVTVVVTVGDLLPFLATRNPCPPWLEHYFSFTHDDIVYIFRVLPRSLTIYPLNLLHLVPPLAQLILGLGVPLTLDLVTTVAATVFSYIL